MVNLERKIPALLVKLIIVRLAQLLMIHVRFVIVDIISILHREYLVSNVVQEIAEKNVKIMIQIIILIVKMSHQDRAVL